MKPFIQSFKSSLIWIFTLSLASVPGAWAEFKVGLILDKGGKDDKSFNASAFKGFEKAKKELKVSGKYIEATDDNAFKPNLRKFAQMGYDLIISIGVSQAKDIEEIAKQFPTQKFAIIDAEVKGDNIRSMVFDEHEGSFLVGAIAAMTSKTGTVGFVGGMDIPLIRRFQLGFEKGAQHVNSKVKVLTNYVGVTADAWNNPTKGKELAVSQYTRGADIIFSAAGASGAGIFDAAEEQQRFAIGVDSNQNDVKPGRILTSMVKRVDEAVFVTCKDTLEGKFTSGVYQFGLKDKGVDYTVDSYNEKILSQDVRKKADEIKDRIIAGKIKVPDYYQTSKK